MLYSCTNLIIFFNEDVFQWALGISSFIFLEPPQAFLNQKYFSECDPELPGHGAVEDEVEHAVGECQHVHHLPQGCVAEHKELIPQQAREATHYPLNDQEIMLFLPLFAY